MDGLTRPSTWLVLCVATVVTAPGCAVGVSSQRSSLTRNAIPAHRLPPELAARPKDNLVPIDFTQLRQPPPKEHVIGAKDVLGIFIPNVLGEASLPAVVYPNTGQVRVPTLESPSVGHPVTVQADGTVSLPLIPPVPISGLTLSQAVDRIREAYREKGVLRQERDNISVDLIRARTVKVFVLREDQGGITGVAAPSLISRTQQVLSRRGTADALDLPIHENDVLHAIAATGGLPGIDAFNEVWILHASDIDEAIRLELMSDLQAGRIPDTTIQGQGTAFIRIPLRVCPGQPLPFSSNDIILGDGDVVYVQSRDVEYFMTGGLIEGGTFPLPRDRDIDILEAIAIGNAEVSGPVGASQAASNFRNRPGAVIPPTRAVVIRTLETDEQIKILVDLKAALNDPRERIKIMPGDLVLLKYTPSEFMGNLAINLVDFGFVIPNR